MFFDLFSLMAEVANSSPTAVPDWALPTAGSAIGSAGLAWWAKGLYAAKRDVKHDARVDDDRYVKEGNPPLKETILKDFATKGEVKDVDCKVEKLRADMQDEFRETRRASADSRGKMYDSIRKVEQDVAELRRSDNQQSGQLKEIGSDIKNLISKVGNLQGKVEK